MSQGDAFDNRFKILLTGDRFATPPQDWQLFLFIFDSATNVERRGRRGGSPRGGKGREGCLRPSAGMTTSSEDALRSLEVFAHRSSVRPHIQLCESAAWLGEVPAQTACWQNGTHDCTRGTPPP
jgi:hypothetical protein